MPRSAGAWPTRCRLADRRRRSDSARSPTWRSRRRVALHRDAPPEPRVRRPSSIGRHTCHPVVADVCSHRRPGGARHAASPAAADRRRCASAACLGGSRISPHGLRTTCSSEGSVTRHACRSSLAGAPSSGLETLAQEGSSGGPANAYDCDGGNAAATASGGHPASTSRVSRLQADEARSSTIGPTDAEPLPDPCTLWDRRVPARAPGLVSSCSCRAIPE
jgi:hypothetical protein